jgi:hypothetical protein
MRADLGGGWQRAYLACAIDQDGRGVFHLRRATSAPELPLSAELENVHRAFVPQIAVAVSTSGFADDFTPKGNA